VLDRNVPANYRNLSELQRGERGRISAIADDGTQLGDTATATIARRLRELGFVPGCEVEVLAKMQPGGEPIAVRVGGATFALRQLEAAKVELEVLRV
jgi:ferrous iron transport protein A